MLIRRQRKPDFEARRNSRRAHHADKQRVEIGTVATLGGASPDSITVTPACAGLVVTHRSDDVVVDGARFREWILKSFCLLGRKIRYDAVKRDAAVWLQEALKFWRELWLGRGWVSAEHYAVFVASYFEAYAYLGRRGDLGRWNLQIHILVAVLRIAILGIGKRRLDFQVGDSLVWTRLRQGNPNP